MAAMLRNSRANMGFYLPLRRWAHSMPQPLYSLMDGHFTATSPPMVLPESEDAIDNSDFSFIHGHGGSMELMAVPKKKVSPHKRGIRNGPKALKPVPVIIRCKVCGRVKLPHFFCCSGIRQNPGEQNRSSGKGFGEF